MSLLGFRHKDINSLHAGTARYQPNESVDRASDRFLSECVGYPGGDISPAGGKKISVSAENARTGKHLRPKTKIGPDRASEVLLPLTAGLTRREKRCRIGIVHCIFASGTQSWRIDNCNYAGFSTGILCC